MFRCLGKLVTEIVELQLNPPEREVMLCVDQKSQFQVLDRIVVELPFTKGCAANMIRNLNTKK